MTLERDYASCEKEMSVPYATPERSTVDEILPENPERRERSNADYIPNIRSTSD